MTATAHLLAAFVALAGCTDEDVLTPQHASELRQALAAAGPRGIDTIFVPCQFADELVFLDYRFDGDARFLGYHVVGGGTLHRDTTNAGSVHYDYANCTDRDITLLAEHVTATLPNAPQQQPFPVMLRGGQHLVTATDIGETLTRREIGDWDEWDGDIGFFGIGGAVGSVRITTDDTQHPTLIVELAPRS
jgi:hypothetical protein